MNPESKSERELVAVSTRRSFFGASVAAAVPAGAAVVQKPLKPTVSARSAARVVGANDRINTGHIGVGGMGYGHLRDFVRQGEAQKDIQVVAICDIYKRRKERARDTAKLSDKDVHHDYHDLLARNDVDVVVVATPDHTHGQIALDVVASGRDIYLQKPMTHTIEEARAVTEAVKKNGRILQIGSQTVSDPRVEVARQLIQGGEIGELLWATSSSSRNSIVGEWNYYVDAEATAETIDWNRWLGTAPKRPFSAERYFRWRKYWDYSGGIATDLYFHRMGPMLCPIGPQFPVSVMATGGIYVFKDREVPDTYATTIEYPTFYVDLSGSMANGAGVKYFTTAYYGHKGTVVFENRRVLLVPERLEPRSSETAARPPDNSKAFDVPMVANLHRKHTDNFFASVRSRKPPINNEDFGFRSLVAVRLGVESFRQGKVMFFDPKTQQVVDKPPRRMTYEGDGKNHEDGYRQRV